MSPTACHVSTFAPTQCGIATYVADLIDSLPLWKSSPLRMVFAGRDISVAPLGSDGTLAADVASRQEYAAMAAVVNSGPCDLVSLQHEFGIFAGDDGEYVLDLVAAIRKPLVTTLHTVSPSLTPRRIAILQRLLLHSTRTVVLSDEDASVLSSFTTIPVNGIEVIRHGVPDTPFRYPAETGLRRVFGADVVFVSSGHLRPKKGYHLALRALALLKRTQKSFRYLLLGRGQAQYGHGTLYREEVRALVDDLGLTDDVAWVEDYLPLPQLIEHITAADLGLVTYTQKDQASSGVLPLMLALGRPVVATSFAYAHRMAARTPGIHLARSDSPEDLCEVIRDTIRDRHALRAEMVRAHSAMRPYVWARVGEEYARVFRAALAAGSTAQPFLQ